MAGFRIGHLTFTYPGKGAPALRDLSLTVEPGQVVVIGGGTGSGKTTLLRLLKKPVWPAGTIEGTVEYDGIPAGKLDEARAAREIGMVFQDPESQIVMETVWQEMCFGMENLGFEPGVIQKRLAETASFFGMGNWIHQEVRTLSGGQKQLLNLAAVMMLRPRVLLLDEPVSLLDPIAAGHFTEMLCRINREFSVTTILSEQRLGDWYGRADRIGLMDGGRLLFSGDPRTVAARVWQAEDPEAREYLPPPARLFLGLAGLPEDPGAIPLSVREGRTWFSRFVRERPPGAREESPGEGAAPGDGEIRIRCRGLRFGYRKHGPEVLDDLWLELYRGEWFGLLGGNGSGKTTLLRVLAGLLAPQAGQAGVPGGGRPVRTGYLPQDPVALFGRDTVEDQLEAGLEVAGPGARERGEELVERFSLGPLRDRHPFDLSGGEQQLLALVLVLRSSPELLLLDEPTRGLDPRAARELAAHLRELCREGTTVVMVTHDIEFCARHADRCGLLFGGKVLAVAPPRSFFSQNHYYTTAVQRMVRDQLGALVTREEVEAAWGA